MELPLSQWGILASADLPGNCPFQPVPLECLMQPFGLRLMKLAPWQPPAHVNTTDSRRQIYSN
jgi:hypothetical protein